MGNLVVRRKSRTLLYSMALLAALTVAPMEASAFQATQVYQPISETQQDKTITLTGRDLTIEQVVDIARNGAKVELSAKYGSAQWKRISEYPVTRQLILK